jgi:hypothetical protein
MRCELSVLLFIGWMFLVTSLSFIAAAGIAWRSKLRKGKHGFRRSHKENSSFSPELQLFALQKRPSEQSDYER